MASRNMKSGDWPIGLLPLIDLSVRYIGPNFGTLSLRRIARLQNLNGPFNFTMPHDHGIGKNE